MQEIGRKYFINKKKLVKKTTFSVALLVAVTLVFSSSLTAADLVNTNEMNVKMQPGQKWITSAKENLPGIDSIPKTAPTPLQPTDWLYFDDGTNDNSLGLTNGGTFEYGIRLTPTELSGYDGYELTTVRHHHGWEGSTAPSVSGYIRIYDEGTATSPGTLLHEQAYTTGSVPGWEDYTLTTPVIIDETKDLWVCLEVTHLTGEYPAGMDPGPAVDGKGDWIYLDPGPWQEIQGLGFDSNWNLWAGLEEGGPGDEHDVGVQSIDSPVTGPAGVITPEATVKNYGNNQETNVPVNMQITQLVSSVAFTEGFEDYTPSEPIFPPAGWSIQSISTETWYKYSSGYARCSEDNTGAQDEWLITDTYDCSAYSTVELSIGYTYFSSPDDDYVEILGSTDGGATWPNLIDTRTASGSSLAYDLSSWAAGQSQVKIAWRFFSTAGTAGSDYFYMRTIKISVPPEIASGGVDEDFDGTWGPYGDNPPAGWAIIDDGSEDPPVWNNNDWHNYYYSSFGSNCARVYYSPYESMDEWLITPTIDCSGLTNVDINFRQYLYFYSTYPGYGYILGSTDNGATFTETIAYYDVTQSNAYYSYDISSWAAGESQVKIAFNYYAPGAQGRYWYVDDIMVGDISDEIIFYENYWFNDMTDDDWGPNGWMQEEVTTTTDADPNIWRGAEAGYSTTPTGITPYSGTYMAIYDTGLLSPDTASARLYTPPMDLSSYGASVLMLKFMMYLSSYSSSYTDHLDVQVSTDGTTWTTIETINAYDSSNPGWVEQVIDLSAYASSTSLQLGFTGVDGGYMDIVIDDISLVVSSLYVEYDQTVYVTVPVGGTVVATFPYWVPDDWQSVSNVDIEYNIIAETQLTGDEEPTNDQKTELITLSYPYLHDIAVVSIDNPTSGPGQTLPVDVTIKNVGQNSECCYLTNAQIGGWVPTGPPTETTYDFEMNDGGFTPSATWDPVGDWEWTDSYDFSLYTGSYTPPPNAYSGDGLWATVPFGDYTNAGGSSYLTKTIDLSGVTDAEMSFYEWHDTWGYWDWLAVNVNGVQEWFHDGDTPSTSWQQVVIDLDDYAGQSNVEIVFELYATTVVAHAGWYIDDVTIIDVETTYVTEYDEDILAITLDPGEEATLNFPDWTPDALAIGDSGLITYTVIAEQLLVGDENSDNDILTETITLDYWHDVLVKEITEPTIGGKSPWDLLFSYDLEAASGALGNAGAEWDGTYFYSARWASNLIHQYDSTGTLVKEFSIPGVSELRDLAYNPNTGTFYGGAAAGTIWEMDFDSETLVNTLTGSFQSRAIAYNADDDVIYCSNWADPVWVLDPSSGAILDQFNLGSAISTYGLAYDNTGTNKYLYAFDQGGGAGTPQYIYEWDLDAGAMTGFTYDVAADFPTTSGIAGGLFIGAGFDPNNLVIGGCLQGTPDMMFCYELRPGGSGGGGYPPITLFIQPGENPIEAIVGNEGVFEETGLTCYAEIYHFIDDPINGTYVWDDSVGNIDLDPLGDEETVPFGSVDFNLQGPWGLWIEMPIGDDKYPNNNIKALGIGVDDSAPTTSHTVDPATPDGENGWYVNPVTISFTASDGTQDWQSGVESIKYKINGGTTQTITGASGSIVISDDGENIDVEYWAIDNVGNEGTHNTVNPINLDQTVPAIDLKYEVTGGNALTGWEFTFTATATDDMSGMDYVEFYFNGIYQVTVEGEGPEYSWVYVYYPIQNAFVDAVGYDVAGNDASDRIDNPKSKNVQSLNQNTQSQQIKELVQNVQTLNNG